GQLAPAPRGRRGGDRLAQLPELLVELALLLARLLGHRHPEVEQEVAGGRAAESGDALAADPHHLARPAPWRDVERDPLAARRRRRSGSRATTGATAAEHAREDVAEVPDVAHVPLDGGTAAEGAARAGAGSAGAAAELRDRVVVLAPLLGVSEHVVGLAQLLEPPGRLGVALVGVGVVLPRLLAEGRLDLLRRGLPVYPQRLVVVLGRHHRKPIYPRSAG